MHDSKNKKQGDQILNPKHEAKSELEVGLGSKFWKPVMYFLQEY